MGAFSSSHTHILRKALQMLCIACSSTSGMRHLDYICYGLLAFARFIAVLCSGCGFVSAMHTESDTVVCQANRKKKKKAVGQATLGSMRIITGSAAGRRLVSPPGEGTRPMMEKVRGAVFSMVASMAGSQPLLPPGSRWLDLFAGTGNPLLVFQALQTQLYASTGCYGRTTWFQSHEHEALHLPCSLYAAMQTCQL